MAVKPGYKQTEVGVIPEEWEIVAAGEIGRFRGGNGFPLTHQGETNGAYPFFKVSDMNNDGNETVMTAANHRISEGTRKQLGATPFPAGSIVLAKVGAAIFLERKKILGQPSCIDNNMTAFMLDSSRADVRFVHTLLLTTKLGSLVSTTALPSLNGKQLSEIRLLIPPLPEQRAIATALSEVDALLGALDRLIAKKRDLKQAAMQQLLTGQTRLPGFHGEWEVKTLGEILTRLANGAVYKASNSSGLPITRIETIADGTIDYSRTGAVEVTAELESYKMLSGDILFSHINSLDHIGKVAQFQGKRELYHGMNLLLLRTGKLADRRFIYFWFTSVPARKIARNMARQAVSQASINTTELKKLEILLPPLSEQTAIAGVLSEMDAELAVLAVLAQRQAKTRALKQGMMQELLTGRTRLL